MRDRDSALDGLAGLAWNDKGAFVGETADLLYHLTVLMEACGIEWSAIADELRQRREHEPG